MDGGSTGSLMGQAPAPAAVAPAVPLPPVNPLTVSNAAAAAAPAAPQSPFGSLFPQAMGGSMTPQAQDKARQAFSALARTAAAPQSMPGRPAQFGPQPGMSLAQFLSSMLGKTGGGGSI